MQRRAALRRDLRRDVLRDRLALAIRVGGDQHFLAVLRRALQLGDRLFLPGNRNEVGREAVVDVDAQLLLGQIHDVPDRRANAVAAAEVLPDRLRLGRRLDDDERARARRCAVRLVTRHRRGAARPRRASPWSSLSPSPSFSPTPAPSSRWLRASLPRGASSWPCSVYRLVLVAFALFDEPRPFHEGAEVVQRDATVDLQ